MILSSDLLLKNFTKVDLTLFPFMSAARLYNEDSAPFKRVLYLIQFTR